jgi:hypothetical protein
MSPHLTMHGLPGNELISPRAGSVGFRVRWIVGFRHSAMFDSRAKHHSDVGFCWISRRVARMFTSGRDLRASVDLQL